MGRKNTRQTDSCSFRETRPKIRNQLNDDIMNRLKIFLLIFTPFKKITSQIPAEYQKTEGL